MSDSKLEDCKQNSALVDALASKSLIGMQQSPRSQVFYLKKRNPAIALKDIVLSDELRAHRSVERMLPSDSKMTATKRAGSQRHRKNNSLSVADRFKVIDKLYCR